MASKKPTPRKKPAPAPPVLPPPPAPPQPMFSMTLYDNGQIAGMEVAGMTAIRLIDTFKALAHVQTLAVAALAQKALRFEQSQQGKG